MTKRAGRTKVAADETHGPSLGPSLQSPLPLLRTNPRFALFTALMFPAAMGLGAMGQTRTATAATSSAGSVGIGAVAIAMAIAAGIAAVLSGGISDRVGARRVFVVTTLAALAVNLIGSLISMSGSTTALSFLLVVAAGGAIAAMNMTSLVPMSMGIVSADARGAVQIVNMLRMALGIMVGVWLAGTVGNPKAISLIATLLVAGCSLAAASISPRPAITTQAGNGARGGLGIAELRAGFRQNPLLRSTFLMLLALDIVVPSQLVAIVLADNQLFQRYHTLVLAGLAGALVSRLILTVTGLRIRIRVWLLAAFSIYAASCVVGFVLFQAQVLLSSEVLMASAVFIGSLTSGYTLEVTAALVQQRCPDEIRGRLTGTLQAGRTLMTAIGVALAATLQVAGDEAPLMAGLAILSILVLVFTRGFGIVVSSGDRHATSLVRLR